MNQKNNNMKFKNKKGGALKTTLSKEIMIKVADATERQLIMDNIHYFREGTVFKVQERDVHFLLKAQQEANKLLITSNVITEEMIVKEIQQL